MSLSCVAFLSAATHSIRSGGMNLLKAGGVVRSFALRSATRGLVAWTRRVYNKRGRGVGPREQHAVHRGERALFRGLAALPGEGEVYRQRVEGF
jgi:hypothetical protein